jgi:hypothetical protein
LAGSIGEVRAQAALAEDVIAGDIARHRRERRIILDDAVQFIVGNIEIAR